MKCQNPPRKRRAGGGRLSIWRAVSPHRVLTDLLAGGAERWASKPGADLTLLRIRLSERSLGQHTIHIQNEHRSQHRRDPSGRLMVVAIPLTTVTMMVRTPMFGVGDESCACNVTG